MVSKSSISESYEVREDISLTTATTALIAGATGLIGNELLHRLLDGQHYDRVIALVRSPLSLKHPKLIEIIVNFDRLETIEHHFAVDDVYCCLGTTIKQAKSQEAMHKVDVQYPLTIAKLAHAQGAAQFVLVSAMSADADSRIFYSRIKGELEQQIREIPFKSISIMQPSLLLGDRKEFRLGERIAAIIFPALSFLLVGPLAKYRAIRGSSVAQAMYRIGLQGTSGIHVYSSEMIASIARS